MQPKPALLLALLLTALIANSIYFLNILNKPEKQTATITRVIDGDTLVINNQTTIRLENINTPEKGEPGYNEAKNFLKQYENQEVQIEETGTDKYKRTLAKIYIPEYLNLEIINQGLATKFLVNKNELKIFAQVESKAIEQEKGIWKKSQYFNCFESQINEKEEIFFLQNNCAEVNIQNWRIKDESRKKYNFQDITLGQVSIHTFQGQDNETDIFLNQKQDLWNNDQDTLYLFDKENNIVHYHPYGY